MTGDGRGAETQMPTGSTRPPARLTGGGEPDLEVLLPGPDPLPGPDQAPGPGSGRQFGQRGDVGGQHAGMLPHVGADRRGGQASRPSGCAQIRPL